VKSIPTSLYLENRSGLLQNRLNERERSDGKAMERDRYIKKYCFSYCDRFIKYEMIAKISHATF
jgi:hypothetical protein